MKERPILFSASMVRALLEGRKTQTRRMKPQPHTVDASGRWYKMKGGGSSLNCFDCPYGVPGDRLWVREGFGIGYQHSGREYSAIPWTGSDPQRDGKVFYRADYKEDVSQGLLPWKSSIHMPRWASRIDLLITDVRVQRLQEITGVDCVAEGIRKRQGLGDGPPLKGDIWKEAKASYAALWESINGAGHWAANPWVWAISFEVLKR